MSVFKPKLLGCQRPLSYILLFIGFFLKFLVIMLKRIVKLIPRESGVVRGVKPRTLGGLGLVMVRKGITIDKQPERSYLGKVDTHGLTPVALKRK